MSRRRFRATFPDVWDGHGVYRITAAPGDFYIGESYSVRDRIVSHFRLLRKRQHRNSLLQSAFDLCGEQAMRVDVFVRFHFARRLSVSERNRQRHRAEAIAIALYGPTLNGPEMWMLSTNRPMTDQIRIPLDKLRAKPRTR